MSTADFQQLISAAFVKWRNDRMGLMAAAISYYAVFSLAPLLIVVIWLTGLFLGQETVLAQLNTYLGTLAGEQTVGFVRELVYTVAGGAGLVTSSFGFGVFAIGATELFYKLQTVFADMWRTQKTPSALPVAATIRKRVISFLAVLSIGIVLVLTFLFSTVLAGLQQVTGVTLIQELPIGIIQTGEVVVSFLASVAIFAVFYKVLPPVSLNWSDVLLGALIAGVLFSLGKVVLGWYIATRGLSSLYGAAGSLLAFLVWLYYSTQIFLFGAEIVTVYARQYGSLHKSAGRHIADAIGAAIRRR